MFVVNAFREGGPFMFVILALGILSIATMLERWRVLYVTSRKWPSSKDFRKKIYEMMNMGDAAAAYRIAEESKSPIGRVVAQGCRLHSQGAGEEQVQARMDEQLNIELNKLDKKTGFLAMYGNVATLAGLLGTIVGMIHSFSAVAEANPIDRATELSRGISEAMNCTAFGLLVAIPSLVAYAFFQSRTDELVNQLTNDTTTIYNDLIYHFDGTQVVPQKETASTVRPHLTQPLEV